MSSVVWLDHPSYENETCERPSEWRLVRADAAEGDVGWAETARTGERGLRLSKSNSFGKLILEAVRPAAVESEREYELEVYLRAEKRVFNSTTTLCVDELAADGELIRSHSPREWALVPRFLPPGEWMRQWVRWRTNARTAAIRVSFAIEGNPAAVVLDDWGLTADPPTFDRKGTSDSDEPPFDEARAREALAAREPVSGSIETVAGRPMFVASDGYRTALLYKHTGAPSYRAFGEAGVHLHVCLLGVSATCEPDQEPDLSALEQNILHVLSGDPKAYVVVAFNAYATREWCLAHPEDVWTAEDGQKYISRGHPLRKGETLNEGENFSASYGSPRFRDDVGRTLRHVAEFLRTHDIGKVVVGFMYHGGNDGQFFCNSINWGPNKDWQLDHSRGHRAGFRAWLREHYGGDVESLRRAWLDGSVTFETACVAREEDRTIDRPFHGGRGSEQRVADSQRYANIAPAHLLRAWSSVVREHIGKPVFCSTYYHDAAYAHELNKYALAELIDGPDGLDAATAVQEYGGWREPGAPGGITGSWGAHRIRGSFHVREIDYRTYRSAVGGEWHFDMVGAGETAKAWRAQVIRDVGIAAANGAGIWFYEMGKAWYNSRDLWVTVEETKRILDWSFREEAPSPVADVAVFFDEDAGWRASADAYGLIFSSTGQQRRALGMSGVRYDLYRLDDIRDPRLPDYKAYLILSAFTVTGEQVEAIKAKARRPGRLLAISGTPGIANREPAELPALAEDLTGIRCALLPPGTPVASLPIEGCDDPIARGLEGAFICGGSATPYVLSPEEGEGTAFGRYVFADRISHAIKHSGGGAAMLLPPPFPQGDTLSQGGVARRPEDRVRLFGGLTPTLVGNIARVAGVRCMGTPGQVTAVGCGVAMCHRAQPGPATVYFEQAVDLLATDGTTVLASGVTEWEPEVDLLDTAVVFYRACSR